MANGIIRGGRGEWIIAYTFYAVVILIAFLALRGCYGWYCDRLAESMSRVHGGDNDVAVANAEQDRRE